MSRLSSSRTPTHRYAGDTILEKHEEEGILGGRGRGGSTPEPRTTRSHQVRPQRRIDRADRVARFLREARATVPVEPVPPSEVAVAPIAIPVDTAAVVEPIDAGTRRDDAYARSSRYEGARRSLAKLAATQTGHAFLAPSSTVQENDIF
jgi:hypothetical protein